MKKIYLFTGFLLITTFCFSQGYEFGIIHNGGYSFSIVATPDFDASDTDVSDLGLTIMLPAGNTDITNLSMFNGRTWTATEVTAEQLNSFGLGDGSRDGFVLNLPPGQSIISHTVGEQITLVMFEVSNTPTSGEIRILSNSDDIALGLSGTLDSFYNANIDGTLTQNYFTALSDGLENFVFSTLSLDDANLTEQAIIVYPNPAKDYIRIVTSHVINAIELYNVFGKQVLTDNQNTTTLDIRRFQSGIYFLKICTDKGEYLKKVIVK
ncbi:T9SS type A sorting domain-containing protein [uncultured Psychroserpens sp.]|uniref:T9SS type A sorting domain-containing protein n=1 Tax=uncultured Psychroserpens sp. TaxID=255436 RepID=UPI002612F358|nr:T9SS type A sorting domain-containing protein [uncultured Psychroserpens sp.]